MRIIGDVLLWMRIITDIVIRPDVVFCWEKHAPVLPVFLKDNLFLMMFMDEVTHKSNDNTVCCLRVFIVLSVSCDG